MLEKYIGALGAFLLYVGASVEPSIGVWIVSVGGTLLAASLGKDKTFLGLIFYVPIGMGWGIFGSQIFHSLWPVIPQLAAAFFSSVFGGEATFYIVRSCREGNFTDLLSTVISSLTPFKKK